MADEAPRRVPHAWIGDDCPPGWRRVGTIDVGDPADVNRACDRDQRIGTIYRGPFDRHEPCAADVYERGPSDALQSK